MLTLLKSFSTKKKCGLECVCVCVCVCVCERERERELNMFKRIQLREGYVQLLN